MVYEIYVQGKFYKSVETDNSMALVWKVTNLIDSEKVLDEIPWYDVTKPSHITVEPEHDGEHVKGVTTEG